MEWKLEYLKGGFVLVEADDFEFVGNVLTFMARDKNKDYISTKIFNWDQIIVMTRIEEPQ